jgi:uncharacterized protein
MDHFFLDSVLHGDDHWRAVACQGIRVADNNHMGSQGYVMAALFGALHDCRRINDEWDPEHGLRAKHVAEELSTGLLSNLSSDMLDKLRFSLEYHDKGSVIREDYLIGLCWDADRSVLTRVDITPKHEFFSCTSEAHFDALIEAGYKSTREPMSWEIIADIAFPRSR